MSKQKKKDEGYVIDPFHVDKRLEYAERYVLDSDICEQNKRLILGYKDYIQFKRKLSKDRVTKWLNTLHPLAKMLGKPFDKATIDDIKALDKKILQSDYSDNTKCDFERMLKKFFKWLRSEDKNAELDEYPPEVKWIEAVRPTIKALNSEDTITWDDVQAMGLYCQNHRDRAFLKSLWESGSRIREHLSLRIKDVKEDEHGLTLDVKVTKTGGKTIQKFLTLSEPDLREWMQFHPKGNDPDAPLWIRIDGRKPRECMSYEYARKLLFVLGKKVGIKKKLNPHNFRHGSLTFWSDFLTDSQVKYRAGWSQGTRMLDVYIHKDVNAIRERILQLRGIEDKKAELPFERKIVNCYYCGKANDSSRMICYNCKKFLDISKNNVAQRLKDSLDSKIIEFTEKNPQFLMQYLNFLRENHKSAEG